MTKQYVVINPGSGPLEGTTELNAIANMKHYITDCGVEDVEFVRLPDLDEDGRFGFLVWKETRCHTVEMPGLPLDKVRFMDEEGQNVWHYPRLYVDGSSWVWIFALLSDEDFKEPEYD